MSQRPSNLRDLTLANLDEVSAELDTLLQRGYAAHGKWNLSQICSHLEQWMTFPMDGFPKAALPLRMVFWLIRTTSGKRQLRSILANGFRPGIPTNPSTVPAADAASDVDAAASLKSTIERFEAYRGPLHDSPIFGELDYETLHQLQLAHCTHHLRFVTPLE